MSGFTVSGEFVAVFNDPTVYADVMAQRIVRAINAAKVNLNREASAHEDIGRAIAPLGAFDHEHVLPGGLGRIDFFGEGVGIEVKIGGNRREIHRQLERYARADDVLVLVLATSLPFARQLEIGGKPCHVANLSHGWLGG